MGIVSTSTPCSPDMTGSYIEAAKIPRVQQLQVAYIVRKKGIPLFSYSLPEKSALSALRLKPVSALQFTSHLRLMYAMTLCGIVAHFSVTRISLAQTGQVTCNTSLFHLMTSGHLQTFECCR